MCARTIIPEEVLLKVLFHLVMEEFLVNKLLSFMYKEVGMAVSLGESILEIMDNKLWVYGIFLGSWSYCYIWFRISMWRCLTILVKRM